MTVRAVVIDRAALVKERPGDEVLYEVLHPIGVKGTKESFTKAQEASRAYWKENYKELPKGQRWNRDIRRECFGAALFSLQVKQEGEEMVERLDNFWDAFRLQDLQGGTKPCLGALHGARLPLGLFAQSLRSSNEIRAELERLGIGRFFYRAISSEELPFDKPDPRLFNLLAEKMSCIPTEIVFIGSGDEGDAQGALTAGMMPILVSRTRENDPPPGVHLARSLVEVPAIVTNLSNAPAPG